MIKHSTLIQRSKKYLAKNWHERWDNDRSLYVCHAISMAGYDLNQEDKAQEICELISVRLGKYDTVFEWLWNNPRIQYKEALYVDEWMQEYRLRWMDSLINEYKGAGK